MSLTSRDVNRDGSISATSCRDVSHHIIMWLRLSVCPLNLGKTDEQMKMEKVQWDVCRAGVVVGDWLGCEGTEKGSRKNMLFGGPGSRCSLFLGHSTGCSTVWLCNAFLRVGGLRWHRLAMRLSWGLVGGMRRRDTASWVVSYLHLHCTTVLQTLQQGVTCTTNLLTKVYLYSGVMYALAKDVDCQ